MKNVSKKQIFDIEKVGFGDEDIAQNEVLSQQEPQAPKPSNRSAIKSSRKELPKMPEVTSTPLKKSTTSGSSYRVGTTPSSPKQVLATSSNSQADSKSESKKQATVTSDLPTRKFRPNVYISPVYGLRQSKAKTASVSVEKDQVEFVVSDSQPQENSTDTTQSVRLPESIHQDHRSHEEMPEAKVTLNDVKSEDEIVEVEQKQKEINDTTEAVSDKMTSEVEETPTVTLPQSDLPYQTTTDNLIEVPELNTLTTVDGSFDYDDILELLEYEDSTSFYDDEEDEVPTTTTQDVSSEKSHQVEEKIDILTVVNELNEDEDETGFVNVQSSNEEESTNRLTQPMYYEMPSLELLDDTQVSEDALDDWIEEKMEVIDKTFEDYGVGAFVTTEYTVGPTIIQIELELKPGTPINKVTNRHKELALNLAVEELLIAPILGKTTIGIELPHPKRRLVRLKEILNNRQFAMHDSPLYVGLGQDISGAPIYMDLQTMPHGLIAGQTGSGKSVCINTILTSILFKASPEAVRLMLIDPKRVELTPYNHISHLLTPVITDAKKASSGLKWMVDEMERRYELFEQNGVRDIKSFNDRRLEFEFSYEQLPFILVVIDELADLMLVSAQDVEDSIMRLTQKARAAGIHLIVATQRPTVDVITGVIKSNIPTRVAFSVAQANDSRTILDESGAQTLLGKGDMFISSSDSSRLKRVQGAYISDDEVQRVVSFVKNQAKPNYLIESDAFDKCHPTIGTDSDPLLEAIIEFILETKAVSTSLIQRRFNVGYNRAARMMDTLEAKQYITASTGSNKPREVLLTRSTYEQLKQDKTRY